MTIRYKKTYIRRVQLLKLACEMAKEKHYSAITRKDLSEAGQTAAGNITRIMGDMGGFRYLLVEYAIEHNEHAVIAQAIGVNHELTSNLTKDQKKKHLINAI